ncbi:MAG TPA: AraC family transcriptional regulator [Chthoniobacteraceae bacterium]|nr:AraC family transcriptional regulator [Chthoniobacteraceae bacterium]
MTQPNELPGLGKNAVAWKETMGILIEPMIIYRNGVSPGGLNSQRTLPFYTWWWIESGKVEIETCGRLQVVRPGQWILIPAGVMRTQEFDPASTIISINFLASWGDRLPLLGLAEPLIGEGCRTARLRELAGAVCEVLENAAEPSRRGRHGASLTLREALRFRTRLSAFVSALLEYAADHGGQWIDRSASEPRLEWVLESIRQQVRAGPLPFDQWQRATRLGRSQLERLARQHLRMSLAVYRDRLLAAEACRRLASRDLLIKQIAADLGFVDVAHFCRWFRGRTRQSPGEFRKSHF